MLGDHAQRIRERILAGESFVRAVFSGHRQGATMDWVRVVVRPVELKGTLHWQISYFDSQKDITKNFAGDEAAGKVDELLNLPFKDIYVETTAGRLQVRVSKKGKVWASEIRGPETPPTIERSHDRRKKKILAVDNSTALLEAVGILTKGGKIKADRQGKFRQINEFLRLLDETGVFGHASEGALRVVDCGCGNAYLTFAIYHYLNHILSVPAHVVGVDVKADLLERHRAKAEALGWEGLRFQVGTIQGFETDVVPDVVVALHACDKATDEALARGIRWGSRLIITAPCCQHELQRQISRVPVPAPFRAVFRDGILGERLGDILTDAFRAAILRIMGYRTDVIQFVSTEHTAKNLMIRSVKTASPGNLPATEEYSALKRYWNVTPYLERLLDEDFAQWVQGVDDGPSEERMDVPEGDP